MRGITRLPDGREETSYDCCRYVADAPAPAAVTVTVPTTTTTTISPQISPVFVQQDQPVSSPVGASTAQTQPAQQSVDYMAFLREQEAAAARRREADAALWAEREALEAKRREEEAARQERLLREFMTSQQRTTATPEVTQFIPADTGAAPPMSYTETISVPAPAPAPAPARNWTPWMLAAVAGIIMLGTSRSRK